jgi:hypothetical protein
MKQALLVLVFFTVLYSCRHQTSKEPQRLFVNINPDTSTIKNMMARKDLDLLLIFQDGQTRPHEIFDPKSIALEALAPYLRKLAIVELHSYHHQSGDSLRHITDRNQQFQLNQFGFHGTPYYALFRNGSWIRHGHADLSNMNALEFFKEQ